VSKPTVLIVEDDNDVRLGYQVLLRAHGYATCFAADAIMAVGQARTQKPDLILLDLGLPAGDGFMVLDRLRANTNLSVIPVIVVSARERRANEDRALQAGAVAYLQKPWDDDELLRLIRRHAGPPASDDPGSRSPS